MSKSEKGRKPEAERKSRGEKMSKNKFFRRLFWKGLGLPWVLPGMMTIMLMVVVMIASDKVGLCVPLFATKDEKGDRVEESKMMRPGEM